VNKKTNTTEEEEVDEKPLKSTLVSKSKTSKTKVDEEVSFVIDFSIAYDIWIKTYLEMNEYWI